MLAFELRLLLMYLIYHNWLISTPKGTLSRGESDVSNSIWSLFQGFDVVICLFFLSVVTTFIRYGKWVLSSDRLTSQMRAFWWDRGGLTGPWQSECSWLYRKQNYQQVCEKTLWKGQHVPSVGTLYASRSPKFICGVATLTVMLSICIPADSTENQHLTCHLIVWIH